jgi:hypothetical protein
VVAVYGTGFVPGATVRFGTSAATQVAVISGTLLTAVAPMGAVGSVDVTVTTPGGTSSTSPSDLFAYGPPTVSSISPDAGTTAGGTSVTLTGSAFSSGAEVFFGTKVATNVIVNATGTSLTATTPAQAAGVVNILVTTSGGASTASGNDLYAYGTPTITGLSPGAGLPGGGTTVIISGMSFSQDSTVKFGANAATVVAVAFLGSSIRVTSPAGSETVNVSVTTPAGTSTASSADLFAYGAPSVSSVASDAGPVTGGTSTTITGSGFLAGATVDFGTTPASSVTVDSPTQITAVSPAHASGPVDVSVTTPLGTSASSPGDVFVYGSPTVTGLAPATGSTSGSTTVTITGTNFTRDATVAFGSVRASVAFVSNTSLTAVSPAEAAGVVDVTVTTPAGISATSNADQFAYSDQLEFSCTAPPYATATTACSGIDLPTVNLDGLDQSTQSLSSTVYITDNRDDSTEGWSVSAFLVPTAGSPSGCAGYVGFCNWSVGGSSLSTNGKIPASDFAVDSLSCTTAPGSSNPEPHVGAGGAFSATGAVSLCTADPGSSGGTFDLSSAFALAIPESAYAGTYHATVEYLVM